MKLYAFVEDVDSDDAKAICQIFTTKEEIIKDMMDGIRKSFESFKECNKGHKYQWNDRFKYTQPEIVEIETGQYYSVYDFNNRLNYKDFIDYNDPIFKEIDLFNYDSIENKNKYEIEKRKKWIYNHKEEIKILENQIKELMRK